MKSRTDAVGFADAGSLEPDVEGSIVGYDSGRTAAVSRSPRTHPDPPASAPDGRTKRGRSGGTLSRRPEA